MIDLKLITKLLWPGTPKYPNCRAASYEELLPESLTMGTLYIGRQGTGKTSSLARHLVEYFKRYPDRAIFVLDWSGSITDSILALIASEPEHEREVLTRRLVYDDLGNPDRVIPLPEFSPRYGTTSEEQVQRVANNLAKLAPELVTGAPYIAGLGLREIAPQLFRVCTAIANVNGSSWQATEAKRLLKDLPLLRQAVAKYGYRVPEAKWFFERNFLPLKENERELSGVTPFQWTHGGLGIVGYEHEGLRTEWARDSRSLSDDDADCTSLR